MATSVFTAATLIGVGGLVAVLGLSETIAEVRPYFSGGLAPEQRFQAIASDEFVPAGSRWSRDLYLEDCLNVPYTEYAAAQSAVRRGAFTAGCLRHARAIVADTPTAANAWLVIASVSTDLRQFDAALQALSSSHHAAAFSQVLASRRVWVAERMFDQINGEALELYRADLATLAQSRGGLKFLAERYVRAPSRREEYVAAVEARGEGQQSAFLHEVRALMETAP